MKNWLVQRLRFSAFIPDATLDPLSTIWPLISEVPPESDESRPRERLHRMAAPEADSVLEVVSLPGRFDIIKSPDVQAEIQPIVHFGDADSQLSNFVERIHLLLDKLGSTINIHRLALGVVLIRKVDSRKLAYEELGKLLLVNLDPEKSRDFLYQINYPEIFELDSGSIELNRLSRWSAMRTQHFMFAPNEKGEPIPGRSGLAREETFVRCEIDNSSAAEINDPFSANSMHLILNRLIELANITASGEHHEAF